MSAVVVVDKSFQEIAVVVDKSFQEIAVVVDKSFQEIAIVSDMSSIILLGSSSMNFGNVAVDVGDVA
jgi:hypothetical protein